jgi:hypothetical protein
VGLGKFYAIILGLLVFCASMAFYNIDLGVSGIIQVPTISFAPCEKVVCVGETFDFSVTIENLDVRWHMVSWDFRLVPFDCDGEVELLSAEGGGFLPSFGDVWGLSYGFPPGPCGATVVGEMLLPDPEGNWTVFAEGDGTMVVFTFLAVAEGNVTYQLMDEYARIGVGLYSPSEYIPHVITCNCSIEVKEPTGDLTLDNFIGIDDLVVAGESFGSDPNHSRWNIWADLNFDSYIGIDDIVLIARSFGKLHE